LGPGNRTEPNIRCLTRDFCPDWAITKTNKRKAAEPQIATTFAEFDKRVQGDLSLDGMMYHSGGHFGTGGELGEMGNPYSSPNDPLFYMHHTNLDRLWTRWQAVGMHTSSTYVARLG
jgi:tyrosinase